MAARARSSSAPLNGFPPARRLRKPGEFKRVYATGRRMANEYFTVNSQPNELAAARLGMSVAVRVMGNAVERNRVRRMIRESFRLHQALVPPLDIIVGVRVGARAAPAEALRSSLERLWIKLASMQT